MRSRKVFLSLTRLCTDVSAGARRNGGTTTSDSQNDTQEDAQRYWSPTSRAPTASADDLTPRSTLAAVGYSSPSGSGSNSAVGDDEANPQQGARDGKHGGGTDGSVGTSEGNDGSWTKRAGHDGDDVITISKAELERLVKASTMSAVQLSAMRYEELVLSKTKIENDMTETITLLVNKVSQSDDALSALRAEVDQENARKAKVLTRMETDLRVEIQARLDVEAQLKHAHIEKETMQRALANLRSDHRPMDGHDDESERRRLSVIHEGKHAKRDMSKSPEEKTALKRVRGDEAKSDVVDVEGKEAVVGDRCECGDDGDDNDDEPNANIAQLDAMLQKTLEASRLLHEQEAAEKAKEAKELSRALEMSMQDAENERGPSDPYAACSGAAASDVYDIGCGDAQPNTGAPDAEAESGVSVEQAFATESVDSASDDQKGKVGVPVVTDGTKSGNDGTDITATEGTAGGDISDGREGITDEEFIDIQNSLRQLQKDTGNTFECKRYW